MIERWNTQETVNYKGVSVYVHWQRCAYKKKTNVTIFKDDDGTTEIEKDYISFCYKNIFVQDSYISDEYNIENRVHQLCRIIDEEGISGLKNRGITCEIQDN